MATNKQFTIDRVIKNSGISFDDFVVYSPLMRKERDRTILKMRLNGDTLAGIGLHLGVTQGRVRQLEARGNERLRSIIAEAKGQNYCSGLTKLDREDSLILKPV